MNGLCGSWDRHTIDVAAQRLHVRTMVATLRLHGRGGSGLWQDACDGVALACCSRRQDADVAPVRSACGRRVMVMDGMLANRSELVDALGDAAPVTCSDATVLLAAITRWGLHASLQRCRGAFSIVLWDARERTLHLVRDRAGERALYYGWSGGAFLFGSELKALQAHPAFTAAVDRNALALLLRFGYIPAPHCIHQGIFKLPAGHVLALDAAALEAGAAAHEPGTASLAYWCPRAEIHQARATRARAPVTERGAVDGLDAILRRAIQACRPPPREGTAAFLSGGTDSSLVSALAQTDSLLPIDTFTLGFDDPGHDERGWASQVARHLGTRHTEHVMRAPEVVEHVAALPDVWCEPFADPSQLPTLLATALLSRHRSVALSGDGGDELFHGHGSYTRAIRNARWRRQCPAMLRTWMAACANTDAERARLGGLAAVAAESGAGSIEGHYLLRVSRWRDPARVVLGATEPATCFTDASQWLGGGSDADRVQYLDLRMDLGEGVLAKVDRAARAYGLATRAPLLDLDVMRYAWSLPDQAKYQRGVHKRVMKDLLRRHLPDSLVDRPKRGFGPPMARWLAGPLREWADALLEPSRLQREGFFDVHAVRTMWLDFCAGQRKWHTHLWPVLMFQAWYAAQRR